MLLAGFASPLAFLLTWMALPVFSAFVVRPFEISELFSFPVVLGQTACVALVGILSPMYPAFVVSAYQPGSALRGHRSASGNSLLRSGLVVVQFAIPVVLMIATLVIHDQLTYIIDKDHHEPDSPRR